MRVVFAGNQDRGLACLRAVVEAGHEVVAVVAHPEDSARGGVAEEADACGIRLFRPPDVNAGEVVDALEAATPDILVLAGYGQILRGRLLGVCPYGSVNLHGGRLPQYRGSSPMNWALINGEQEITISAILLDAGVDTGDVIGERTFPVGADDTIADVQARANALFPDMLVDTLARLEDGTVERRPQVEAEAAYWPLRFPDDGLIVWDQLTAQQVHNRVRALAPPYPGAFTLWGRQRVTILRSKLESRRVMGEAGRVYGVGRNGILVCASDCCLRVTEAVLDDGTDFTTVVSRYDELASVRRLFLAAT